MQIVLPLEQLRARRIPARVIKLLRRLLATDPEGRPQSARRLLDELETCRIAAEPRRRQRGAERWPPLGF